jgi:hypothetical protein
VANQHARRLHTGYQQLTVSTSVVQLTVPGGTDNALIRCVGASVRMRGGTVDPTSTVGFPMNAGDILEYDGPPDKLKFIRSGASDATLEVFYSA